MTTGWVWHERYAWHDTGRAGGVLPAGGWLQPDLHVENGETKRRFRNLVELSGLLELLRPLAPRPATVDELCRFHTREYVERIRALSDQGGGDAGELTPFGAGSFEIAQLAAGGVIAAVDAVLDGSVANAYALVRPPGHHALADRGMGFCLFGNVAVAVLHARAVWGVERVAVVDWDVHHGNGTQAAFYEDPGVLTVSLHQAGNFPPRSGLVEERGVGPGEGLNVNVPLPAGSGRGAYRAAFTQIVEPAVRAFAPDLIVVSSGYDAASLDPLGRMMLNSQDYRWMTESVLELAAGCCSGRVVVAHEGGYSPHMSPFCGLAVVETLAGRRAEVVDPFAIAEADGQELQPHQARAVDEAAAGLELLATRAAS